MDSRKPSTAKSASSKSRSKGNKRPINNPPEGSDQLGKTEHETEAAAGGVVLREEGGQQQANCRSHCRDQAPEAARVHQRSALVFEKRATGPPRAPQEDDAGPQAQQREDEASGAPHGGTSAADHGAAPLLYEILEFQTHETGRPHELSEMLDRHTVQKLPLDIIQNLEWLKLNSNRQRIDSVRRPPRVFLQDEYDELTRNFGKSVVLSKKVESCSNSLERPKEEWKEEGLPLAPEQVLVRFPHYLTRDEKVEIKDYEHIYYIGHKLKKRELIHRQGSSYDNDNFEYKCELKDHIAYRYQLVEYLGKGSYGQVYKVFDHKKNEHLALKIIKNKKKYTTQAQIQIKILTTIREYDPDNMSGIVKIKDFVVFRKHVCIVFELLCQNLYELIKRNNYNGLDMELIRRFAIQILNSLKFLKQRRIIHCDLKPENILLKHSNKSGIKIIDFGSSCFEKQIIYSYIQSRYYRAPEVTLEIRYDTMIDMWSFGCILAELYIGAPLFPGDNEFQQVNYLVGTLGLPPASMIRQAQRSQKFFNEDYSFTPDMKSVKLTPGFGRPLRDIIEPEDHLFLEFLQSIIKWDPKERVTPQEALRSAWILEGLPQEVKNMHKLFNQQPRSKRSARLCPNQSKELKKKSKSRDKDSLKDSMAQSKSKSKSKSRSKEISVRIKQSSKNEESLKRQSQSIPVKIKLNLETKVKVKGDGQPKIQIQINKPKKSKEFFKER